MNTRDLEIITPSYGPDLELCRDLSDSIARHGGPRVRHTIVVPERDLSAFGALSGPRTRVTTTASYLPRSFRQLPGNLHVNLRHPLPPVRGWISQQIVKLAAAAASTADLVLLADSDLAFVRPFDADTFTEDRRPLFYRLDGGVHDGMVRHLQWDAAARQLVGLDATSAPPPDYIAWPCVWEPRMVRELLHHVTRVGARPWASLVGSRLHFSEMVLYGVFIDEIVGTTGVLVTDDMRCVQHSDEIVLDRAAFEKRLAGLRSTDVAVMISAKSGTPLALRRELLGGVS